MNKLSLTSSQVVSLRGMVELIRAEVPFSHHVLFTTLPRGELQIALISTGGDSLLKQYARGYHREDRLTWGAIKRDEPVKPSYLWPNDEFVKTQYWRELMAPNDLAYVISLPLMGPVLSGYPGALHLCRNATEGEFTAEEMTRALRILQEAESHLASTRALRRHHSTPQVAVSAAEGLLVLDANFEPLLHQGAWSKVDARLREQMVEQANRRMHQLNGSLTLADRVQFPDSQGNVLVFRVVTYRTYPALGDGAMSFFCPQPLCSEWGTLRSVDFQADTELSRLIPALAFMQENFASGPTLPDIAKTVNLSQFHFHRRFTELLGLTPKEFLFECQIHEAKTELLAADKELSEIASRCGFAHQSHFTSRFKQASGLTPTRWRRLMTERRRVSRN